MGWKFEELGIGEHFTFDVPSNDKPLDQLGGTDLFCKTSDTRADNLTDGCWQKVASGQTVFVVHMPTATTTLTEAVLKALQDDHYAQPYTIGSAKLLPDGTIECQLAKGRKVIVTVKEC